VHLSGGADSQLRLENFGVVASGTDNTGLGGNVSIDFDRVTLRNGASISVESTLDDPDAGRAGGLTIDTRDLQAYDSAITARSVASDGGDIEITAGNGFVLGASSVTAEVGGGAGTTGGNIEVSADYVVLENGSQILARAVDGQGGFIQINTQGLFKSSDSTIDASAGPFGVDGEVHVNAPDTNLMAGLTPLSEQYLVQVAFATDQCSIGGGGDRGSFVLGGGGAGIPEAPDAPLPSFGLRLDRAP
jgi:hypothetical protein